MDTSKTSSIAGTQKGRAVESQLITVENQQTALNAQNLFNLVWAVNYQVLYHYGRSPWVQDGHAALGHLVQLPDGAKPPAGAWNLILLDTTDQQGALGYHDDVTGTNIPYCEVFVKTAIQGGDQPSAVAAHETLEMLVDPFVEGTTGPKAQANPAEGGKLYILEVGDPVQGNDYDVGAPEGRTTGVTVCDFALPAWWGLNQTGTNALSFRESVTQAFEIAPQGYISWAPAGSNPGDPSVWQQSFGAQQDRLPKWASRLPRIHPVQR
jgi:hypothetical protein